MSERPAMTHDEATAWIDEHMELSDFLEDDEGSYSPLMRASARASGARAWLVDRTIECLPFYREGAQAAKARWEELQPPKRKWRAEWIGEGHHAGAAIYSRDRRFGFHLSPSATAIEFECTNGPMSCNKHNVKITELEA
ncbi:MAG: hypothetical protein ACOC0P_00675 [Planctomycetota bacterium]